MTTLFIILPCFNEEQNLVELVKKIDSVLRSGFVIVAVDDGSTDSTPEILDNLQSSFPLVAIHHKSNQGLAGAIRTSLKYICSKALNNDLIITMDADLTHDPRFIPSLAEALGKGFDVAIASRYVPGGGQLNLPMRRILLSKGVNSLVRLVLRISVNDCTSGFRCYRSGVLFRVSDLFGEKMIEAHGFDVMMELLVKCVHCGARVTEIPLVLDYGLKRGGSKLKTIATIRTYLLSIVRLAYTL